MLKIHHMPPSRSVRVVWAAEELGLPYEIVLKERAQLKHADFMALNPLGTAPVIQDGDVTMSESCAIVEYLVGRYDPDHRLSPASADPARAAYLQWTHFAEATLMPPITAHLATSGLFGGIADDGAKAAAQQRLAILLDYMDDTLAERPFIAGPTFSAADIAVAWTLGVGYRLKAIAGEDWPHLAEYAARMNDRPGAKIGGAIPAGYVNQPPGSVQTPRRRT